MADFWNQPVFGTAAQPATTNFPGAEFEGMSPNTAAVPASGNQMTWGQFLSALWSGGQQQPMSPTAPLRQGSYGQQQNPLWSMPQSTATPLQGAKDDSGEVLSILSGIIGAPGAGAK